MFDGFNWFSDCIFCLWQPGDRGHSCCGRMFVRLVVQFLVPRPEYSRRTRVHLLQTEIWMGYRIVEVHDARPNVGNEV